MVRYEFKMRKAGRVRMSGVALQKEVQDCETLFDAQVERAVDKPKDASAAAMELVELTEQTWQVERHRCSV